MVSYFLPSSCLVKFYQILVPSPPRSVLAPLLLAAGATGSRPTLAVNDTHLAAEVIRNMGKMFDDPKGGPSLLFQQFIEALQQYTKQVGLFLNVGLLQLQLNKTLVTSN